MDVLQSALDKINTSQGLTGKLTSRLAYTKDEVIEFEPIRVYSAKANQLAPGLFIRFKSGDCFGVDITEIEDNYI